MDPGAVGFLKLLFGLVGLILLVLAYLIGVKKKVTLIAGYDPKKCKDNAGLARFAGAMAAIIGLFVMLYPWVYGPGRTTPLRWVIYYVASIVILVVIMVVGASMYERKPADRVEE